MGCFLACFGYSKKRKPPKPSNRISSGPQRHVRYQPLDSLVTTPPELSNKGKEGLSIGIKKKVSFNLNVKSYEPIPNYETSIYFSDEEEECDKNKGETTKESEPLALSKRDSMASKMGYFPLNHRYHNIRESYEEDDSIELEEDDMDEEDEDEDEDEDRDDSGSDYGDDKKVTQDFPMKSQERVVFKQLADEKAALLDQELKKVERYRMARDRSQYVHSVLNPVENLSQWKAVKARTRLPLKKNQSKENLTVEQQQQQIPRTLKSIVNSSAPFNYKPDFSQSKPLVQGIAVDASLSNWLVSSGTGSITDTCSVPVVAGSSNKNSFETSRSQRVR